MNGSRLNWLFLDMDGFFASAEQHLRPELRGRPVGVVPVETDGTCLIAANFAAKQLGIKTGTRVPEARAVCPGIALVKARPEVYVDLHEEITASIDKHIPVHKAYSIDEWAARLCGNERNQAEAVSLANRIKEQVYADLSPWLSCSVGLAPTRLLAKIASDLDKPDGVSVLSAENMPQRLSHLKPKKLVGISDGIDNRLRQRGIATIEDLWALDRRQAREAWGSVQGEHWWTGFHGEDEPEIATRKSSMSHANVLEPQFRTDEGARRMLVRLIARLGMRLRREGYFTRRLGVHVGYADGEGFGADVELPDVQDTPALLASFGDLWDRRRRTFAPPKKVGAFASDLIKAEQSTGLLFDRPKDTALSSTMDTINRKWGVASLYFGAMHGCSHTMDQKIAFGRIPSRDGPAGAEI